jgi:hypothetical protein
LLSFYFLDHREGLFIEPWFIDYRSGRWWRGLFEGGSSGKVREVVDIEII